MNEQTNAKRKTDQRYNSEFNNPCVKESELSRSCLENNSYNYGACSLYFDNYNACKKFWGKVVRERYAKGIQPHLPLPNERAKIKEEYLSSKGKAY